MAVTQEQFDHLVKKLEVLSKQSLYERIDQSDRQGVSVLFDRFSHKVLGAKHTQMAWVRYASFTTISSPSAVSQSK